MTSWPRCILNRLSPLQVILQELRVEFAVVLLLEFLLQSFVFLITSHHGLKYSLRLKKCFNLILQLLLLDVLLNFSVSEQPLPHLKFMTTTEAFPETFISTHVRIQEHLHHVTYLHRVHFSINRLNFHVVGPGDIFRQFETERNDILTCSQILWWLVCSLSALNENHLNWRRVI